MEKSFVYPADLVPGMRVAETVLNDYGAIVISEGAVLDENLIRKLENVGVYNIQIFDEEYVEVRPKSEFYEKYSENTKRIKEIISDISKGVSLNTFKVNIIVDSVLKSIEERGDVIGCLNEIRGVDEYTYSHCINVAMIAMLIGKWMRLDKEKIRILVQAGLLHDIGKAKIDCAIFNKPGKLTDEEFEEIKNHPMYGYRILESETSISKDVLGAVLMHHEKENGSGYPNHLTGGRISLYAKIIAVADIFDAMTSNRAYKKKDNPFKVFKYLEMDSLGKLNPVVVNALLNNMASYYVGDMVRFNNGEVGQIVYINPRSISNPIIKVGERYVDMLIEKNLEIDEFI